MRNTSFRTAGPPHGVICWPHRSACGGTIIPASPFVEAWFVPFCCEIKWIRWWDDVEEIKQTEQSALTGRNVYGAGRRISHDGARMKDVLHIQTLKNPNRCVEFSHIRNPSSLFKPLILIPNATDATSSHSQLMDVDLSGCLLLSCGRRVIIRSQRKKSEPSVEQWYLCRALNHSGSFWCSCKD